MGSICGSRPLQSRPASQSKICRSVTRSLDLDNRALVENVNIHLQKFATAKDQFFRSYHLLSALCAIVMLVQVFTLIVSSIISGKCQKSATITPNTSFTCPCGCVPHRAKTKMVCVPETDSMRTTKTTKGDSCTTTMIQGTSEPSSRLLLHPTSTEHNSSPEARSGKSSSSHRTVLRCLVLLLLSLVFVVC